MDDGEKKTPFNLRWTSFLLVLGVKFSIRIMACLDPVTFCSLSCTRRNLFFLFWKPQMEKSESSPPTLDTLYVRPYQGSGVCLMRDFPILQERKKTLAKGGYIDVWSAFVLNTSRRGGGYQPRPSWSVVIWIFFRRASSSKEEEEEDTRTNFRLWSTRWRQRKRESRSEEERIIDRPIPWMSWIVVTVQSDMVDMESVGSKSWYSTEPSDIVANTVSSFEYRTHTSLFIPDIRLRFG